MPEFFKSVERKEESEKFGRNIETKISFIRHQIPGKTPEGMSADFLTPAGQEAAKSKGANIEGLHAGAYASPKLRAQETVDLMFQNVNDDVNVVNRELSSLKDTKAEKRSDKQRPDNQFRVKVKKELDALVNFGKIKPQIDAYSAEQKAQGDKRSDLDLMVEYYLNNPEIDKANGILTPREAAAEIAERAATELGMTERFYNDSKVELVNVSHGPKLEPFLQQVIGFKSLTEIGGAVQPGEGFSFEVKINEAKEKEVKLLFRDKEYPVDEEQIKTLAQEYRDKLNKK